jgi:3-hydroxyisobutyrate dehydrogenase-like beta-hydroxyacid dehydrogenase
MKIAFLGLGEMGSRMAQRLLDAGHELTVWNRTASKAEPLAAAGATVAATPTDAARSAELVITMLANPDALRAVAPDVLAGLGEGSVWAEMSTVGPGAVTELAATIPTGVELVDAPVRGSLPEAAAGKLVVFVGGPDETVARVRPVLEALGRVDHVGPLGSGASAKLVANSTLFGTISVLAEALALAAGLGLSRETALEVLAASPLAEEAKRRHDSIEAGDYPVGRFPLPLAHKDARLVVEAAKAAGVELRLAPAAERWLAEAAEQHPELDYSAVIATILGSG